MTKFVTTRFPLDLYEKLKEKAKAENRSLSSQIIHLLRKAVE